VGLPDARPPGYPTASAKLYSARVAEPEGLSPDQHECRKLPSSLPRAPLKYRDRRPIKLRAPAQQMAEVDQLQPIVSFLRMSALPLNRDPALSAEARKCDVRELANGRLRFHIC